MKEQDTSGTEHFEVLPILKLYGPLILGHSLSDGIDGKWLSYTAIGSCAPWHGVILQPPPSFIKVSFHGSIFIQEAIVLVLLERKYLLFINMQHDQMVKCLSG